MKTSSGSKDDLFKFIIDKYNTINKPISLSEIKRKFKDDTLNQLLEELEKEGKIERVENRGKISYKPIIEDDVKEQLKIIRDEIRRMNELLQKLLENNREISIRDFDEAYERIKDSLDYAPLERIRIELGMSKEEFYSKFRKHVEENYDLIAGGEEGFVRRGSLYGIIKRRR